MTQKYQAVEKGLKGAAEAVLKGLVGRHLPTSSSAPFCMIKDQCIKVEILSLLTHFYFMIGLLSSAHSFSFHFAISSPRHSVSYNISHHLSVSQYTTTTGNRIQCLYARTSLKFTA